LDKKAHRYKFGYCVSMATFSFIFSLKQKYQMNIFIL